MMLHQTFSVVGHHPFVLLKDNTVLFFYKAFFLIVAAAIIRFWKLRKGETVVEDALVIFAIYALVWMQGFNYSWYLRLHVPGATVQARYLFPVLAPFYGVVCYYIAKPMPKMLSVPAVALIAAFFIWADFPYFIDNATVHWYVNIFRN